MSGTGQHGVDQAEAHDWYRGARLSCRAGGFGKRCAAAVQARGRLLLLIIAASMLLAACGAKSIVAPEAEVQRAIYREPAPPSITLYTMINNRSGEGGHSALLINASQRVLFDPSGSWYHPTVPERNDLLFGMTPLMVQFYNDYHARVTYHVVTQTVLVAPEVAEQALRDAQAHGAVPPAFCANSVSQIVRGLPGFGDVRGSLFPAQLMRSFAKLPGVEERKIFGDDPDNNKNKLAPKT